MLDIGAGDVSQEVEKSNLETLILTIIFCFTTLLVVATYFIFKRKRLSRESVATYSNLDWYQPPDLEPDCRPDLDSDFFEVMEGTKSDLEDEIRTEVADVLFEQSYSRYNNSMSQRTNDDCSACLSSRIILYCASPGVGLQARRPWGL